MRDLLPATYACSHYEYYYICLGLIERCMGILLMCGKRRNEIISKIACIVHLPGNSQSAVTEGRPPLQTGFSLVRR